MLLPKQCLKKSVQANQKPGWAHGSTHFLEARGRHQGTCRWQVVDFYLRSIFGNIWKLFINCGKSMLALQNGVFPYFKVVGYNLSNFDCFWCKNNFKTYKFQKKKDSPSPPKVNQRQGILRWNFQPAMSDSELPLERSTRKATQKASRMHHKALRRKMDSF